MLLLLLPSLSLRRSRKRFTTRGPSSLTRRCCVWLSPIAQYSPLLPPVGVWAVSQSQCGRSPSQAGYPSSPWWAVTPANKLIGREPILDRRSFPPPTMSREVVSGISTGFPVLSQCRGQVAHVLLTRSPLITPRRGITARLACVKHAASVRPEPGSNSPLMSYVYPPRPVVPTVETTRFVDLG